MIQINGCVSTGTHDLLMKYAQIQTPQTPCKSITKITAMFTASLRYMTKNRVAIKFHEIIDNPFSLSYAN